MKIFENFEGTNIKIYDKTIVLKFHNGTKYYKYISKNVYTYGGVTSHSIINDKIFIYFDVGNQQ